LNQDAARRNCGELERVSIFVRVLSALGASAVVACLAGFVAGSALATPTTTTSALEQSCVSAGTAMPRIVEALMRHPGDHKTQTASVKADYGPMPDECVGIFLRVPDIKFQIQDPQNHQRWVGAGPFESFAKSSETVEKELDEIEKELEERGESCDGSNTCHTDNRIKNKGGVFEAGASYPTFIPTRERYRCTPGKGVTHVRALLRNIVRNTNTSSIAGKRITAVPVRVKRAKTLSSRQHHRGGVRGPC
jgi:hypothetical protein